MRTGDEWDVRRGRLWVKKKGKERRRGRQRKRKGRGITPGVKGKAKSRSTVHVDVHTFMLQASTPTLSQGGRS